MDLIWKKKLDILDSNWSYNGNKNKASQSAHWCVIPYEFRKKKTAARLYKGDAIKIPIHIPQLKSTLHKTGTTTLSSQNPAFKQQKDFILHGSRLSLSTFKHSIFLAYTCSMLVYVSDFQYQNSFLQAFFRASKTLSLKTSYRGQKTNPEKKWYSHSCDVSNCFSNAILYIVPHKFKNSKFPLPRFQLWRALHIYSYRHARIQVHMWILRYPQN